MPDPERFDCAEEYYSTAFHEFGHATGHSTRLKRDAVTRFEDGGFGAFGDHAYSQEELVAEMTAAFLCGHCGIEQATLDNSAAYIDGWLQKLRADAKLLVVAAAQAQKAADWLLQKQEEAVASEA